MTAYNRDFYAQQMTGSRRSAEVVVPIVVDLLHPKSVIDIGCGVGTWLSVYKECGVETILGVDGNYVNKEMFYIEPQDFMARDLGKPLNIGRTFDLVQTLEVAEHLDEDSANDFVDSLARLGKVVLFSAAVPHQLGTNHVNEQFLDYWVNLFKRHDYELVDCIRPLIWDNQSVEVWYRQNTVIFAQRDYLASHEQLRMLQEKNRDSLLSVVHPELYSSRIGTLLGTLAELGLGLHRGGQLDSASSIYKRVLHFNPKYGEVWDLLGSLEAQRNRFDEALAGLDRAIKLKPGTAVYYFHRGQVYAALGRNEEAKRDYQHALTLNPSLQSARDCLNKLI